MSQALSLKTKSCRKGLKQEKTKLQSLLQLTPRKREEHLLPKRRKQQSQLPKEVKGHQPKTRRLPRQNEKREKKRSRSN